MGDLILGIILLIALLDGWRRGIIKLLGSYGGIIIGVFLARRLTPLLLPSILPKFEEHLGQTMQETANSPLLADWFFSNTAMGRLLELVIFVLLTAAITWLVSFMTGAFGSVVNATPLIGSLSRGLGALLELLIYIMVLYFIYVWFLPWLVGLLPDLAVVNTIFTSSQVVLGIILDIGSLIWLFNLYKEVVRCCLAKVTLNLRPRLCVSGKLNSQRRPNFCSCGR